MREEDAWPPGIALHKPQALQRRAAQNLARPACRAAAGASPRRSRSRSIRGHAVRRGLISWPRIPLANRVAVAEPMREITCSCATRSKAIPERTLQRMLAFVSHPASPAFGAYPNQAGFAAYTLVAEVRAGTA